MKPAPPTNLRCEYLTNPLGIDTVLPRFSWVLEHNGRDQAQTAFRLIVASTAAGSAGGEGDLWDTGRVESPESFNVVYAGKPLASGIRYHWCVQWWDGDGRKSPFSEPAFFETAFLKQEDWSAGWIGMAGCREFRTPGSTLLGESMGDVVQAYGVYLRKDFHLRRGIHRARASICGLGLYELRLNGKKLNDRVLDPAQTDYGKGALYSTYDVTGLLGRENAAGIILGNGRHISNYGYGAPRCRFQLHVEYEDGGGEIVVSDETWKASHGPLTENSLYDGEIYDARLEMPGWDLPGFDDSAWETAARVGGVPLAAQMMPPMRVTRRLTPSRLFSPEPGVYVFDFGQNYTGWVRLAVRGPEDTEIRIRYAELIDDDGTLNTAPNQNARATDVFILKGEGVEVYEPRFTSHGFRYVEVTGFPGVPTLESVLGCVVHTDLERSGVFHCSCDLINRIHRNVNWGLLSNFSGIPTDCPQRDERFGWLGDAHLASESAVYNFDMAAFYTKYLRDIRLAQKEDGTLPDIVPAFVDKLYPADPAWGSAYLFLAWTMFLYYGDLRILEEHFDSMLAYVRFLGTNAEGHILRRLGKYGDWCPPGSTAPKKTHLALTSTWFYHQDACLIARMADALGREEERAEYERLAHEIRDAFNAAFLEDKQYAARRISRADRLPDQTSNVLPLYSGIVPEDRVAGVLKSLVESVADAQDDHLDTGIIGTRYLLDVLTAYGHGETAYRVATQKSYPGWGYMVEEGATTLWERWEKITKGGMNSHNHIMLGSVDAWFYRSIAGISCAAPGWKRIRIRPGVFGDLTHASATLNTVQGSVHASWERSESMLRVFVRIPVGCEAAVELPLLWENVRIGEGEKLLWKDGKPAGEGGEPVCRGVENDRVILGIGSGEYRFDAVRGDQEIGSGTD